MGARFVEVASRADGAAAAGGVPHGRIQPARVSPDRSRPPVSHESRVKAEKYMRSAAPAKYHDLLIPDFEVGCKRRIFDSGYLKSLHEENLILTDEKPLEIVPEGVRTAKGIVEADVIVLANGFVTNDFLIGLDVRGQGGKTLQEHWSSFGGAEAYNCSVLSGFPNMFILLGPNAATGHTSAVMAAENSVNYALRIIRPMLEGRASIASLKWQAEKEYSDRMQKALRNTVWNSGCQSWYVKSKDGGAGSQTWNAMSYPWSQAHFWYRSLFPVWSDWEYRGRAEKTRRNTTLKTVLLLVAAAVAVVGWCWNWNLSIHDIEPQQLRSAAGALVVRALTALRTWKAMLTASLIWSVPFSASVLG
ncbi:hypothetical protein VTI74DRAFT_10801 [Chaetomium olivicolor]